ncbi:hypothetical protein ZIOFF_052299 [Zingiber officinale]|uniref:GPN-loop GTPase 2 n=1 Tax=Zingiber officinale TaxID=94328 RepID=A0A8J5KTQ7_ZINOF|nr:hypothetical protein ZIOFF_052299 [Zingiber officinale]
MAFGQAVIGPPGSGKTTYCNGMSQFLKLIGSRFAPVLMNHAPIPFYNQLLACRKVVVVNLDPANDSLPYPLNSIYPTFFLLIYQRYKFYCLNVFRINQNRYECAVNIEDLIKLSDVMVEHSLGPNGGLVYCMDYLEKNMDWLESKLKPFLDDHYFLFDFPGQVELFFLHSNTKNIITKLVKKLDLRLTAVHLIDAHLCCDPGKYVSGLILSLTTMLHLELPHINVLSKIDLIENYGKLVYNLEFYTDVEDLSYLQYHLDQDPRSSKYRFLLFGTILHHVDIKILKNGPGGHRRLYCSGSNIISRNRGGSFEPLFPSLPSSAELAALRRTRRTSTRPSGASTANHALFSGTTVLNTSGGQVAEDPLASDVFFLHVIAAVAAILNSFRLFAIVVLSFLCALVIVLTTQLLGDILCVVPRPGVLQPPASQVPAASCFPSAGTPAGIQLQLISSASANLTALFISA